MPHLISNQSIWGKILYICITILTVCLQTSRAHNYTDMFVITVLFQVLLPSPKYINPTNTNVWMLHAVSRYSVSQIIIGPLRLIWHNINSQHLLIIFGIETLFDSEFTALKSFKSAENHLHCFHSNGSDLTLSKKRTLQYFDIIRWKV